MPGAMSLPLCRVGDQARNVRDVHDCGRCPHDVRGPATVGSPSVQVNGKALLRRCDTGVHAVCCGTQVWEAIQGSATVLVDGQPAVRLNDTTRHCGGMGTMIEGSADILVGGPAVSGRPIHDVAAFILDEMTRNATGGDAEYIRDNLDVVQWDSLIPGKAAVDQVQGYKRWYDLVKTGRSWDHKKPIMTRFGKWAYDADQDRSYSYETWSNIHYGYVGRAVGIDAWTLRAGAGAAQYMDGNSPSGYWDRRLDNIGDADVLAAFDEAEDQAAIDIGIRLWEEFGTELTEQDLMRALRDVSDRLKMLAGVAC